MAGNFQLDRMSWISGLCNDYEGNDEFHSMEREGVLCSNDIS